MEIRISRTCLPHVYGIVCVLDDLWHIAARTPCDGRGGLCRLHDRLLDRYLGWR